MKKQLTFLIGILICFVSCNFSEKEKKAEIKITKPIVEEKSKKNIEEQKKENYQFVENDSIAHLWQSELESLTKSFSGFIVKTKLKQNNHDETQTDTIKTLTFDKSIIEVYSTDGFYAVWSADIKNSELPIWSYVKVGMKKYQLEKTLANRLKSDTIRLGNLEQTSVFEFYFSDDELDQVKFEGYVD
ncbi:hypothetical protein GCM10011344_07760 [Dokdonia pacifica]|uniref:Uncharacterized protein n=1 Tax=Dokdonia pacifica TaxID=1627892 RepID=A0A238YY05_9FLAO|nr:hypothetical protein [Dokdonia pacifica]GGG09610.1 hypothetical protein GCM10011344_07760 [Dokdonia pacifica]SNR75598.1 hypothetical protein SAMN06265376_102425 [Dokdonia pacifica]